MILIECCRFSPFLLKSWSVRYFQLSRGKYVLQCLFRTIPSFKSQCSILFSILISPQTFASFKKYTLTTVTYWYISSIVYIGYLRDYNSYQIWYWYADVKTYMQMLLYTLKTFVYIIVILSLSFSLSVTLLHLPLTFPITTVCAMIYDACENIVVRDIDATQQRVASPEPWIPTAHCATCAVPRWRSMTAGRVSSVVTAVTMCSVLKCRQSHQ